MAYKRLILWAMLATSMMGWAQSNCEYKYKSADLNGLNKAIEAYNAKHYSESATQLRKLSARVPNAPDPYFYLGMVAVKQDKNSTAIRRYFTKLFEVCDNYPNALAYYYRGVVYYSDNQFDQAVEMLNKFFEKANQTQNADNDAVYEEASNYLYWSQFLAEAEQNKSPFNPIVVRGVSSHEDDILPYFSWDKQLAIFLRKVSLHKGKTFYARELDDKTWRMCESYWRDTCYSTGSEMAAPFNLHESEGGVTMTADNRLLYYSVAERNASGYNNCDIYYSEFKGGTWTEIKNAGLQVNGDKSWESQPSITPDGQYLYFASNRAGGMGGTDIWRCRRLPNGDWSRAENLGSTVNTTGNEKSPFIHADGHTLYFASDGWQGFGGYDMYFINLNDNGAVRPTNMGLPINTENDDICFGVSASGNKAYFSGKSVEYEGVGGRDVYEFELFPSARPEAMKVVPITMVDTSGRYSKAIISVSRFGADKACYWLPQSISKTSIMLSSVEDNVVSVISDGCMPWVTVVSGVNVKKGLNIPKNITLTPMKLKGVMKLPSIIFNSKRTQLTTIGQLLLDEYVAYLQDHPRVHLSIQGSSEGAAKLVYDYLLSKKLRAERFKCQGDVAVDGVQFQLTQI